ncbi:PREDICTED: glycine-rich RNA-binding protein 3, mitochondrial-like [Brassica oleracea var. oleracea]|uniref:glycine-rich RNA-binding protein 3, mitochondrial-like n=1 Tax=Brassica oleracea var. oleracea TaxID=109376 RepID=UPI0006A6E52C|nr:PREDICTED: glycine-rich RNA-binding protein 3, mitochondrial-like [Brassica oleracea var. oleracea]
MAFLSKFGNVLKQTTSKQLNANGSLSSPSLFQAIRCMSSSKLFIGGMEYGMNEDSVREAFRKYGDVVESKNTGRGGLGLLHSPLQRRPLVLSKIMESDEFKASSKLETVTFSEMKHEEIEALVEFMYCVDGSISLDSLKKHVG